MTNLFSRIKTEVESNLHGWCSVEKAHALAALVVAIRPKHICEVGIWGGRSFIPMAMALKEMKCGKIIGIDPWSKSASTVGMDGNDLKWWSEVDHEAIYQHFLQKVHAADVGNVCDIYRCMSHQFPKSKIPDLDILHVDGNHGEEASCYDVETFGSRVRIGGFMFYDDVTWGSKAATKIPELGFMELYRLDTGAMYQKVK